MHDRLSKRLASNARLGRHVRSRVRRDGRRATTRHDVACDVRREHIAIFTEGPRLRRRETDSVGRPTHPDPRRRHRCPTENAIRIIAHTPIDPGGGIEATRNPNPPRGAKRPAAVVKGDPPPFVVAGPRIVVVDVVPVAVADVRLEVAPHFGGTGRPHRPVRGVVDPSTVGVEGGPKVGQRGRIGVRVLVAGRHVDRNAPGHSRTAPPRLLSSAKDQGRQPPRRYELGSCGKLYQRRAPGRAAAFPPSPTYARSPSAYHRGSPMFESAELGHRVDRRIYEAEESKLRAALLIAQMQVVQRVEFPVILVVGGVEGGGKSDVVNLLLEWMDPRHIQVHALGEPTGEERGRPPMWRYWRVLPPKGKTAVFLGSWYTSPIIDRVYGELGSAALTRTLDEITRFERMLVEEGTLIVKLWLHLTKRAQRKRLTKLASNPDTAWRVSKTDWKYHANYDHFVRVSERALRETNTAEAPWTVVEATDARYRNLTVGRTLLDAMRQRLERKRIALVRAAPPPDPPLDSRDVIEELDLSKSLSEAQYDKRLPRLQGRLNALSRDKRFRNHACVAVFEGNDAAGKGGAVRRVTRALDARRYHVVPIAAPTEEERAQPYLWRFWRHLPKTGQFAIFDRSWYGRLLVERVEGLTPEADWLRAYREIVDFEESLAYSGIVIVKFWMAISKKEQLARFRAREKTPFKRFKITREDWRNRGKWPAYEHVVCDMVDRTSTDVAPWHLVEANDKRWARVRVLETLCDAIEAAI